MRSEPLRRRVRARALDGLAAAARLAPPSLTRGALALAAEAARFSHAETQSLANLELALGSETSAAERRRIARGVRRHAARQLHEWIRLAAGPGHGLRIDDLVEVDPSIAILEREHARRRGVLVVTAHLGNWELLAIALRQRGFDGAVVGRRRARDSSARFLVDMRAAWDLESIPQDTSPRVPLRVLQSGGVLGLLTDLDVRRVAGEFLPFFGVPALTMLAPASLARAAGVPLVPVRCVLPQGADARTPYRLLVEEPLELERAPRDRRDAARELCARQNGVFERWIRETPEQWAWHQPRWRTRPGSREILPLPAHRASASASGATRPTPTEQDAGAASPEAGATPDSPPCPPTPS